MANQEVRELKHKLKLAHKHIGKQGDAIHGLRGEVAELQTLISKESRGVYRRIQQQYDALYAAHRQLEAEHEQLEAKLEQETVNAGS